MNVPEPPAARYAPPPASVDPDRAKGWIRRMAPILRAHSGLVISGLGCALAVLLLQTAIPLVVRAAIDKALIEKTEPLGRYVILLGGIGVLRLLLGFVFRFNLQRLSLAIEYDLRNLMYEHMTRLSFSYFDRVQTGQLISRANSDIRSVQMFLGFGPLVAISLLTFVFAVGLMITIHPLLTLVAVSTMPLVYVAGHRMRNVMFPISWIIQARGADVATIVEENVTGTRVVKSFAAEERQVHALARAARRLRWANEVMVENRARWAPAMQNLPRVGAVALLLYGGWLAVEGSVTVGSLVAFNSYIVMLQMPFQMLGFMLMMAQRAAASAGRIFEILDAGPEITNRPGAIDLLPAGEPGGCRGDVAFESVSFGYGEAADVLTDFDLRLQAGETVALVGRTGSGKSTVARLLPRFYDARRGRVTIDDHDVRDLTLESLRAQVGLVLDEPFLFSDTIRANIAYGRPGASIDEVEAAARSAGASQFIERLPHGYDTVIGERGYTLSGGQRQRIAIARTLLLNPRILILDDATSSIDVRVEAEIHDALRTLMQGRTTLIIAHRLSTIALADRVVLLQHGRIAADGTHAALMATVPAYAEVLAHAEEEYVAAHAPDPEGGGATPEDVPPMQTPATFVGGGA